MYEHIIFDEYKNFGHLKVNYKDTRTIFLLLSLKVLHTRFGGSKQQLGSYLFKFFWIKPCSQYLLWCFMYYLLRYYKEQTASGTVLQKRCSRICGENPR